MAITQETLRLVEETRAMLEELAAGPTRSLTAAWIRAWDTLVWQFGDAILDLIRVGGDRWPTRAEIDRAGRSQQALYTARRALEQLAEQARNEIAAAAATAIHTGVTGQEGLITSQLPASSRLRFNTVAENELAAMVERTAQQIHAVTWPLSDQAVEAMHQQLVRGMVMGDNPRTIAPQILARVEGEFNGGLARALNIARTEILDAHRAAAMLSQRANAAVLDGWQWCAHLSNRTCFPAGTRIATRRGQVPIEDVRVGDQVLTHAGRWRRVYDTMNRLYSGPMVTVEAGDLRVTATADHPFLIERQGELQWMEAQHIRCGDRVLSDGKGISHGGDHRLGEVAVERRGGEPDNGEAARLEEQRLLGVPVGGSGMPVRFVDLQGDLRLGDDEIDGPKPAGDHELLGEGDAEGLQREPDIALGDRLPRVPPVALPGAEPALRGRDDPEVLPACEAVDGDRRSAALFGAMRVPSPPDSKDLLAAGARPVLGIGAGTCERAMDLLHAPGNRELAFASRTGLRDVARGTTALGRAVRPRAAGGGPELGLAVGTVLCDPRPRGGFVSSSVGALSLMGGVASLAAVLSAASANPRRRDLEVGAASLASPLHRHIVSRTTTHNQHIPVFNVEVDEDHSYVANGIAVHNCPSCWSKHGNVYPVTDPGPWDHQSGRCTRIPVTRSWRDLGFNIPEPPSIMPDAQTTFRALPKADQLHIMGPARLQMLDRGDIAWADLSRRRTTSGWRDSYTTTPLRDLTPVR